MDEQLENPLCFGTLEYSSRSYICKNCRVRIECSKIVPKKLNNIIPRRYKKRDLLREDLDE